MYSTGGVLQLSTPELNTNIVLNSNAIELPTLANSKADIPQ